MLYSIIAKKNLLQVERDINIIPIPYFLHIFYIFKQYLNRKR